MQNFKSVLKNGRQRKSKSAGTAVEVTMPSDGGYAWVIVVAAFFVNFLIDGSISSFGKLLTNISKDLQVEHYEVAIVGSLFNGMYFMGSPFASAFINSFGFRLTGIVGTTIIVVFMFLASTATNLGLLITYHVFCGIGTSFLGNIAAICLGYHFFKYRPLAFGISTGGSGIGTFCLQQAIYFILRQTGELDVELRWQHFMKWEAIVLLTCYVLSMFFVPPKVVKVVKAEDYDGVKFDDELLLMSSDESEEIVSIQNFSARVSERSIRSMRSLRSLRTSIIGPPIFPTMAELLKINETDLEEGKSKEKLISRIKKSRHYCWGDCCFKKHQYTRPLYKDDILYEQSLPALVTAQQSPDKLRKSQFESAVNVQLLLTRAPPDSAWIVCGQHIANALKLLFDLSLFRSTTFLILGLSSFCYAAAVFAPYMYMTDRALSRGMEESEALWLLSVMGLSNTAMKVIYGAIMVIFPRVSATRFVAVSLLICGLSLITTGLRPLDPFSVQVIWIIFFVQGNASMISLKSIIYVETLGLPRLTNAYGLLSLIMGFGISLGTPLLGILKDIIGNYIATFVIAGILMSISAILMFFLPNLKKWEEQKLQI